VAPEIDSRLLQKRLEAAQAEVEASLRQVEESWNRLSTTRKEMDASAPGEKLMQESGFARLQARLGTLPVIEQAKGILMAQSGCQPEEAFDILRRASQRTNVKVRDLAADIVRRTVERGRGSAAGGQPARPTSWRQG
jgi:hypothetical protein